jgi:hypothetical protein
MPEESLNDTIPHPKPRDQMIEQVGSSAAQ